jgi:hypothetical protein
VAISLFILTAIIHAVLSFYYGVNVMYWYLIFGIIYLLLGISMLAVKRKWLMWLCLIMPSIGLISSLIDNIVNSKMVPLYPFLALIDIVIIVYCIMDLRGSKGAEKSISANL